MCGKEGKRKMISNKILKKNCITQKEKKECNHMSIYLENATIRDFERSYPYVLIDIV